MNNLLSKLGDELIEKEGYQYQFIEAIDFVDNYDQEKTLENISLINNGNHDYFIFFPIEFNDLNILNNEYQIYLDTYLKQDILDKKEDFKFSDFFEQNRTLILITKGENTPENRRIVAEIEEDPYFFKKQVLLLNDKETEAINILLEAESILEKCQTVISNSESFNQFKKELSDNKISDNKINNSALYSLVAKLYEKLPFLKLEVTEKESKNLDEIINKKLSEELQTLKNELINLDLNDKDVLKDYINSVITIKEETEEKEDD